MVSTWHNNLHYLCSVQNNEVSIFKNITPLTTGNKLKINIIHIQ